MCHHRLPQTWALWGVQHLHPHLSTPHTCWRSNSCLATAPPTAPWPCSTLSPATSRRWVPASRWGHKHKPINDQVHGLLIKLNLQEPDLTNNTKIQLNCVRMWDYEDWKLPRKQDPLHFLWKRRNDLIVFWQAVEQWLWVNLLMCIQSEESVD